MDIESAWGELQRFAVACDIELDSRAEPGFKPDLESKDESEVSDYNELLRAIRRGKMVVGDNGVATVKWKRPASTDHETMVLDPDSWHYGKAIKAANRSPVSKAAKSRQDDDNVSKLHRFLECLAGGTAGDLGDLANRDDSMFTITLGNFIMSE
jgi:hypothetical protein